MLIGIEASRANRPKKTGVEWYAFHVMQEMKKLPEAIAHSWLMYGEQPLSSGLERGPANWHEVMLKWAPKYLWTQIRLSWEMWRRPPNVLFVPAHVLPRVIPKRTVVTLHDIGFHRMPSLYKPIQRWYHEWSTKDILKHATRIITVSEFCKQEIVDAYGADPSNIFVTYNGVQHDVYKPLAKDRADEILKQWKLPTPFMLFIGRLEYKKNVLAIVEAFHRYKEMRGVGEPLQLVLAGIPGVGYEEIEKAIEDGPAKDAIHITGYISEQEKVALLSRAEALIHPAWYEGFGLTPLEAMACGCPVICSHAASLPEVVGMENALWFDPADPEALARNIGHLMDNPSLRLALRERGFSWVKAFTWERTAKETMRLLTEW